MSDEIFANYEEDDNKVKTNKKKENKDGDHRSVHNAAFKDFLLKPELIRALTDCGFELPSTVQHECIPQAILGTDILCQAKSGMGKTAVFVLATLQQIENNTVDNNVDTLILCHTRELAFQIFHEFNRFKKYLPNIRVECFYGGINIDKNREILKNEKTSPHILIGTPGRILALTKESSLKLDGLKRFILDECDQLLEKLDMRKDIQDIFRNTPHEKQVMMFSATLSKEIRPVCKKFMHNPLEIFINDDLLFLDGLQQYYTNLEENKKNRKLVDLLDSLNFNQLIIFVKSRDRAKELNRILLKNNFPSACIYGEPMKQEERIERYRQFKNFEIRIMIATDLFGRGVDIEKVNVVINYDMPENADTYLHRVGRAGRFGTKGLAISFVTTDENGKILQEIQDRFVVKVPTLPNVIDSSTYMPN
eukprot:TRINITY_DN377_c0_g1_i2.p1 TRINITY_DN377_c0_g1~~TRINITY_DN377_c0_g1_i2.p1  ORF type:complete len:421 (-),score=137.57 TRINITY_DN377_c0_g1_i2:88-1350(-)